MEGRGFDHLARALGGAATRRSALAALAGIAAGLGLGGSDAAARRKRREKPKGCQPRCADGQSCRQGSCVCDNGGDLCAGICCANGDRCQSGACVAPPPRCIAAGEACEGRSRRCCDGRACASGQGGQRDVACYAPAGGACQRNEDCVYDTTCTDGACIANPRPDDGDGGSPEPDHGGGGGTCSPGQTACDGACVDTGTDSRHCGACGNACAGTAVCVDGTCASAWSGDVSDFAYRHIASFGIARNPAVDPPLGEDDPYLFQPGGIAVDSLGTTAWVSDTENHRIVVLSKVGDAWVHTDSFGEYQYGIDNLGQNDGKLQVPRGMSVSADGSKLWIADVHHGRVVEWTRANGAWSHTASFGTPGDANLGQTDGLLKFPNDVFVDAAGTTAWVADTYHDRITTWTRNGATWVHASSFIADGWPTGVFVDPSGTTAWVASWDNYVQVRTRSGADWNLSDSFGANGTAPLTQTDGQIRNATGVAVNPAGTVAWIADTGLDRVVVWTKGEAGWAHTASFGTPVTAALGQQDRQMDGPRDLFVDATGRNVWVADALDNRITVWTV